MNVWIINHYAGYMYFDERGRHYYFAKYLKSDGYNPVIFCSNVIHNGHGAYFEFEDLYIVKSNVDIGVPFIFIKGRSYEGAGRQRIANMLEFYIHVKKAAMDYAKRNGKPDVIYASSVHPLALLAGIELAKDFGVGCISEIRDLWPESLISYGMMKRNSLFAKLLYQGERWLYKKSDRIIFTMEGGKDYIRQKGWDDVIGQYKIFHVNNGVDLEKFDYRRHAERIEDEHLNDDDVYKLIYVGSLRQNNDIDSLLNVAKQINITGLKFLIWGDGDKYLSIKNRIRNEGINNVVLKGAVDNKYVPYILSKADICLMHGKTSDIDHYGVSLNKSFEYLASGKPIITTMVGKYDYISNNGAGIQVESYNAEKYAEAIRKLYYMPKEAYLEICRKSRETAEKYDYKVMTKEIESILSLS